MMYCTMYGIRIKETVKADRLYDTTEKRLLNYCAWLETAKNMMKQA